MRTLREEAARFDRRAPRYDRWLKQRWFFGPVHRVIVDALEPRLGERFLEVGCGTGNLTLEVARRTGRGLGIDPAPAMVARAREKSEMLHPAMQVRFAVAAAESLPFPDDAFDVAASSVSIHHWVDAGAGLRELGRVLRPGGRLVVADIGPPGRPGRVVAAVSGLLRRGGHHELRTPQELAAAVRHAGFERVRYRRTGFMAELVSFVAAELPG